MLSPCGIFVYREDTSAVASMVLGERGKSLMFIAWMWFRKCVVSCMWEGNFLVRGCR